MNSGDLSLIICARCRLNFYIPHDYAVDMARRDSSITCPNGHVIQLVIEKHEIEARDKPVGKTLTNFTIQDAVKNIEERLRRE